MNRLLFSPNMTMKMKTFLIICGIALVVLAFYGNKKRQGKHLLQEEQGQPTERPYKIPPTIIDRIKKAFGKKSESQEAFGPEFVEVLRLMDIVDYFKSLKLRKGHDIPFVANAKHPKIQEMLNDQSERPFALFVATYNEDTDNIENYRSIEANELDDEIKNIFGDEPLVVLT